MLLLVTLLARPYASTEATVLRTLGLAVEVDFEHLP
jgi:hypothetical protein